MEISDAVLVRRELSLKSPRREEYHTNSKKEEGWLDWSHPAWELPCKTRYWRKDRRKDRSDEKTKKKM